MTDELQTELLWGPNRYSEFSVMCAELQLPRSKNVRRAVEFVASRAAKLVTAALQMPSRAIAVASERTMVVFEVPLHSVGRHAVLEALLLMSENERGRREKWPVLLARAKRWATHAERQLASLLMWARERDLPVRPTEVADRWSVGDGRLSTTVSLAAFDGELWARLDARVKAETIGRLPAIVVGGEYGKTACARLITHTLASWDLEPELIGDSDPDDANSMTAARRLSPHTLMAVIEVPGLAEARRRRWEPYPDYHAHLTIILGTDGPVTTLEERYDRALSLAKRTLPGGTLILSSDDVIGRRLARALRGTEVNIICVSTRVKKQRADNYSLIEGLLAAGASKSRRPLLSVGPFGSVGGWPSSYGTSLVAAFAALEALNARPQHEVVQTLTRFYLTSLGAGCFGLHLVRGVRVLVHRANSLTGHTYLCSEVRAMVRRLGVDSVRVLIEPPRAGSKVETDVILGAYRRAGAIVTIASPKSDELVSRVELAVARAQPESLIVVAAPNVDRMTAWCRRLAVGGRF